MLHGDMCKMIGRAVGTPAPSNMALWNYALSFVHLPIPDPNNKQHYFNLTNTANHIINKDLVHDDLQSFFHHWRKLIVRH